MDSSVVNVVIGRISTMSFLEISRRFNESLSSGIFEILRRPAKSTENQERGKKNKVSGRYQEKSTESSTHKVASISPMNKARNLPDSDPITHRC